MFTMITDVGLLVFVVVDNFDLHYIYGFNIFGVWMEICSGSTIPGIVSTIPFFMCLRGALAKSSRFENFEKYFKINLVVW